MHDKYLLNCELLMIRKDDGWFWNVRVCCYLLWMFVIILVVRCVKEVQWWVEIEGGAVDGFVWLCYVLYVGCCLIVTDIV